MATLATKVTDEFKNRIEMAAKEKGTSVSDYIKTCLEDSLNPKEYYYEPKYDYEGLRIDRLLEILESKNYNLKTVIETMTQSALDAPAYRRKRGMDWGA